MRPSRARSGFAPAALAAALLLTGLSAVRAAPAPLTVGGARLEPVAFAALPGFPGADPAGALVAFRRVCAAPISVHRQVSVAGNVADLIAACAKSLTVSPEGAAGFFRTSFSAYRVVRPDGRPGFLTGYFEPELPGSLEPGPDFTAPLLARPEDLGSRSPYPDRAAIEDGALGAKAKPILWLRDRVDLLVLQVQGSGRIRLPDGRVVRALYDGRNGRPYTAVAKLIVQEGHLPLEGLTLARWTGWLRDHPDEARRLIRQNASYIFFRQAEVEEPHLGPPGAARAPLSPGIGLAVDSNLWRYGLPFWLEGHLPGAGEGESGRLTIAADTGSAIVGPARGDLFVGSGADAGVAAGNLRDAVGFVVLLPKRGGGL